MNRQKERIALRCQIVEMRHNGNSLRQIAAILGISKTTVRFWLRRWETDRDLSSLHKGGRARKTTPEQDQQILEAADNPLSTAASIAQTLQLNVTPRTVRRRLRASRAPERTLSKKQELSEHLLQMMPRLASQHIQEGVEFWGHTVFTGEETFSSAEGPQPPGNQEQPPLRTIRRTTLAQRIKFPGANQRLSNYTRTMILNIHGYFRSQDTETSETNLMLKSANVTGVCMRTIQNIKKHAKGRNSIVPQKLKDVWSVHQLPCRARTVILNLQKYLRSQDETISETDLMLKTAAITGVSMGVIQDVKKQSKEDAEKEIIHVEEEDVEILGTKIPTAKGKSPDLEGPSASEFKQDNDKRELMEVKEAPIDVKTEPSDMEQMEEKWQSRTTSVSPEAKKSRIDFEKVWVKVEHDMDESLNECEKNKSRSGFEEIYIKSEYDINENPDTHDEYEVRNFIKLNSGT
ncbi:uncharacterized protein LOC143029786 isoform X2 [Oratosquilla oratoria]|uniref:uncharacterized protein LOC143029786 isoform X2 n=1 Tax=Oratosquilla oratoria TaxID=337810 RepID=UPI003F762240